MLGNEKLLFDELYEKTKDCGRVQFVKLLMTKEQENQLLKEQVDYLRRSIERKEETIIELEHERVPYENEYVEKLKKQLTTYQILHRDCKVDNLKNISKIEEMENQQKEFIEWLENEIDRLEKTEFYIDSIQKAAIVTHEHNLSKYKEIIGVSDDKTN